LSYQGTRKRQKSNIVRPAPPVADCSTAKGRPSRYGDFRGPAPYPPPLGSEAR